MANVDPYGLDPSGDCVGNTCAPGSSPGGQEHSGSVGGPYSWVAGAAAGAAAAIYAGIKSGWLQGAASSVAHAVGNAASAVGHAASAVGHAASSVWGALTCLGCDNPPDPRPLVRNGLAGSFAAFQNAAVSTAAGMYNVPAAGASFNPFEGAQKILRLEAPVPQSTAGFGSYVATSIILPFLSPEAALGELGEALGAAEGVTEGGSVLEQASSAAFKAADQAETFTVGAKHLAGSGGRWAQFAAGTHPNALLQQALRSPNATFLPNDATSFRVVTDLGVEIGTKGQTGVRVVVDFNGHVVTWFPVNL